MGRKKKKVEEVGFKHLETQLYITKTFNCQQCPIKIYYSDKSKVIFGIGNIFSKTIMILPSYDINAKINYTTLLSILQNTYEGLTGNKLLEEIYVTRWIKCLNKTSFNLEKDAINSCINYLYYEINQIHPSKIIIFGKAFDSDLIRNNTNAKVFEVISPGVMYYDNDELKLTFINQLTEAINDDT